MKSERKKNSKLLVHYLNLAEQGDKQAQEIADRIAKTLFERELPIEKPKIIVTCSNGFQKQYESLKKVSVVYGISMTNLYELIDNKKSDNFGRRYTYKKIKRSE